MIDSNTLLFENKSVEITYDDTNNIVVARWKGFLKMDTVKEGCNRMLSAIQSHRVTKHLSDQRELKVLSKEVQSYLVESFFPTAEGAGLRKLSILAADDIFAQATVNNVNTSATKVGKISFKTFNAYSDCIDWLNS